MSFTETRLGPYEIRGALGAGGMGEVYRATDTRLKRQVAIKILPAALAGDPDRLARFQREAEVLASLNHPHIAAIYGLEETGTIQALVMELVEGPTLADRIAQGPLPVEEAVPIARQIAQALEAAHAQGIIHRDLKPANIKVRDDGTVKVLDFGLAKLTEGRDGGEGSGSAAEASDAPTMASPAMTVMGAIMGTAAYMSPEQARGRAVDKRTDIWAFGAVLYEMLTGTRAFTGDDLAEIIASVMKTTPDWTPLSAAAPPAVVNLVQRCLEKDRNARISDIAIARYLLADPASLSGQSAPAVAPAVSVTSGEVAQPLPSLPPASRRTSRWTLPAAMIITGAVLGGLIGWLASRRTPEAMPVTHLQMDVAPAERLVGSLANSSIWPAATNIAITPDGRTVVFAGMRGTSRQLFVRALDHLESTPVAGTEGASRPFLSPDGGWIGFFVDRTIKKVSVAGGPVATIGDLPAAGTIRGTTWADDGRIYVSSDGRLFKVSAAGGTPVALDPRDNAAKRPRDVLPQALPGGKALLLTVLTGGWDDATIVVYSLENGSRRELVRGGADARVVSSGHLLYMKSGTLMAVPFDVQSQQLRGAPVAVLEHVMQSLNTPFGGDETGAGQFVVAANGTLVYVPGGISPSLDSMLMWVDRKGVAQPLSGSPTAPFVESRLSPNGQKIATAIRGKTTRNTDLWIYDVGQGAPTRLTSEGGGFPVWSPDGTRLAYGGSGIYTIAADGSGTPQRLTTPDAPQFLSSWSRGDNVIAFLQRTPTGSSAIWTVPTAGDRTPRVFLESRFNLMYPEFSPDGHWLAYVSTESGTPEVYVQPYPGPGAKVRISTAGGLEPLWTPNGRELLFRSGTFERAQFLAATIRSTTPFQADPPHLLFDAKPDEYDSTTPTRSWDVSPDGQRLLLRHPLPSNAKPVTVMQIVLNWTAELTRLAPAQ